MKDRNLSDYFGRFIEVFDGQKRQIYSIKNIVPMHQYEADGKFSRPNDVEIILDKKNNTFFSIDWFLTGKSWVKEIKILDSFEAKFRRDRLFKRYRLHESSQEYALEQMLKLEKSSDELKFKSLTKESMEAVDPDKQDTERDFWRLHEIFKDVVNQRDQDRKKATDLTKWLKECRSLLEDLTLEKEHMADCDALSIERGPCSCMDRNYYNEEDCLKRAKEFLEKYAI